MSASKKLLQILMVFVLAFAVLLPAQAHEAEAATPVTVYVNGQILHSPQSAEIINGSTMVPMRAIFEALDAQVEWFPKTRTVSAYDPTTNKILSLVIDNKNMFCANNNEFSAYADHPTSQDTINFVLRHTKISPTAPVILNGSTLVPVRVISEALDCQVGWDGATRTVTINR